MCDVPAIIILCYTEDKTHYVRYNNIISFTTVVAYLYHQFTHIYTYIYIERERIASATIEKKIHDKPKIWHVHARNTIVVRGNNRRIKMSIGILLLRLRISCARNVTSKYGL